MRANTDYRKLSYTAAESVPIKIFLNPDLVESIEKKKFIPPYHIQLNPTNRCNLNCPWCSCSARDKQLELTYEEIMEVMELAAGYGCRSVTITGGGEPLLHPNIKALLRDIRALGIEIGLVTNGHRLRELSEFDLSHITWCRISLGDGRIIEKLPGYWKILEGAVMRGRNVDWSFSYVVTNNPDYELIFMMMEFANKHKFTHVRFVCDILNAEKYAGTMAKIRRKFRAEDVDDSIAIYQTRAVYTRGTEECYISLLKPVLGADGYWYPCCGVQYALAEPSRDYEKVMRMSDKRLAEGLKEIVEKQKYFNGSVCVKCYYKNYNDFLKVLLDGVKHKAFV